MTNTRKAILWLVIVCFFVCGSLIFSCKEKKSSTSSTSQTSDLNRNSTSQSNSIPADIVVYPKEAKFPNDFSINKINAYIDNQRINILDGWKDLLLVLKNDTKAIIDKGSISADGFEANAGTDGGIIRLVLTSGKHSIEFGGKVGMTIQEVKTKYPGGYFCIGDLEYPDGTYFYLVVDKNDPAITRGFVFYLDENKNVKGIAMGYVIFAE
jgi:hypothetical protein